jgi:glycosyltransferase involved in cell wall biosynthesis
MSRDISVIIPAYNEGARILNTVSALRVLKEINSIYVVDDGSTDDTYRRICELDYVRAIKQPKNLGKGAALKRGVLEALDSSDIIVFLDADLEASSVEAIKLIVPIMEGASDVTIAKFPPPTRKGGFGLVKGLSQIGLYFHTGKRMTAALSGQRAFKASVLKDMNIGDNGFGVELSMLIDLLRKGCRVLEIEVEMKHRETERSLAGFYHRGRQFYQISKVILSKCFFS